MKRAGLLILCSAVAAGVVIFVSAATNYEGQREKAVLSDLAFGRTTSGSLHAASPQFVCLDQSDAMRGAFHLDDGPALEETRDQLVKSWRCTVTSSDASFSMTADGKEHFATPHGTIDLWAS